MRPFVQLEHAPDRTVEERAVVRHDDDPRARAGDEALEPVEPLEVEVVGRLVEQEDVEAGEQDCGQSGARGLAPGQRHHRQLQPLRRKPDVRAGRPRAGVQVVPAERQEPLERLRVRGDHGRLAVEPFGQRIEVRLRLGNARAPREVSEQGLVRPALGLLRHVPDGQARGRAGDRSRIRLVQPRRDPQERRLPHPVRPDDAEPGARRHGKRDPDEDRVGAVGLGDAVEGEHANLLMSRAPEGRGNEVGSISHA